MTLAKKRSVARFDTDGFVPWDDEGKPDSDLLWKNVSYDPATGKGSYLMIFPPGVASAPHRHEGAEEWFMVEGDLIDNDGHTYRAGDFVSLAAGSEHSSHSPGGCKIVVTHHGPIVDAELST